MTHELAIKKARTGFSAKCSCGKRITSARGCNRSGYGYALVNAYETYAEHCRQVGCEPVMHEDCRSFVTGEV